MRRLTSQFALLLAACLALASSQPARAEDEAPAESGPPRFALLVGVSEYQHLPERDQLAGCAGDVQLMQTLLADRYGFAAEDIVTLTGEEATGEGIRGEMAALAERVAALPEDSPPAQVVFHFSGHGSQMPDQPVGHADCDEVDGLDETLVPADATAQGGEQDIRDDELYAFLESVAGNGRAQVWVVLDCCHSGSGARGATKFRRLNRGLTFLPPAAQADRIVQEKRLPAGVVVLSACAASEVEPEYVEGEEHYGLLTRYLTRALQQDTSRRGLSYAELHSALQQSYTTEAALLQPPSPQLEGDALAMRTRVLGGEREDRPERIAAHFDDDDQDVVILQEGVLHGVQVGDAYTVFVTYVWSRPGMEDFLNERGCPALVEEVSAATCKVRLLTVARAGPPGLDFSQPGVELSETRVEYAERGSPIPLPPQHPRIRLHVVHQETAEDPEEFVDPDDYYLQADIGCGLSTRISRFYDDDDPIYWVGEDQPCDYILRIVGETGALFPATGLMYPPAPAEDEEGEPSQDPPSDIPAALVGGWGPIDLSTDAGGEQLSDYLQRIAQAQNVLRMAAEQQQQMEGERLAVELELVSIEWDGQEATGSTPWPADAEGHMVMQEGDTYALRVTNNSALNDPIYITILRVDPNLGIDVALPYQIAQGVVPEQELAPGESRTCSPYRCGNDYGLRWAIVLASREPQSFTSLAQRGLPVIRGEREEIPLDDSWTADTIRWVVEPSSEP